MPLNEEQPLTSQLYNLDAERAVLGACLLDVRAANEVREQISAG